MKFTMKVHYGILMAIYLSRSGRSNAQTISSNLGISRTFVEQIARLLRQARLIKSVKGPGGGHELIGNPTVGQFVDVLADIDLKYANGFSLEQRSWFLFTAHFDSAVRQLLHVPIDRIVQNQVVKELAQMETATSDRTC